MAVDEVARRNIIGSITPMELNMPVLLLLVKRTNLVPATIVQLAKQSTADLKKPLKVSNGTFGLVQSFYVSGKVNALLYITWLRNLPLLSCISVDPMRLSYFPSQLCLILY